MYRSIMLTAVACGAFTLSGCGGTQTEASTDMAAQNSSAENSQSGELASQPNEIAPQPPAEIQVSTDREELARYGACFAILSSMNNIINNSGSANDPAFQVILRANAHQAAVYKIASLEIIQSSPESDQEQLRNDFNKFLREEITNKKVTMSDFNSHKNRLCKVEDMTQLNANRIMNEYSGNYEAEIERIRDIRL